MSGHFTSGVASGLKPSDRCSPVLQGGEKANGRLVVVPLYNSKCAGYSGRLRMRVVDPSALMISATTGARFLRRAAQMCRGVLRT